MKVLVREKIKKTDFKKVKRNGKDKYASKTRVRLKDAIDSINNA